MHEGRHQTGAGFRRSTIIWLVVAVAVSGGTLVALTTGPSLASLGRAGVQSVIGGGGPHSPAPPGLAGSRTALLTSATAAKPSPTTTTAPPKVVAASSTTTTAPLKVATTTTTAPKVSTPTMTATAPPAVTTTTTAPKSVAAALPSIPSLPGIPSNCSTNVSASLTARLDALPPGAVFTSPPGACYLVDQGLEITHPLTMVGGTLVDGSSVTTPSDDHNFHPIIEIFDTSQVTIDNMTIEGKNVTGSYHGALVEEAGIKVVSSADVTLDNINVSNTFGDGLELVADLGHRIATPDTNLVVNNYTTTNAGRQGMTFAEVSGARLNNVNIVSPASDGFDFESDVPALGSGNITITDCTYQHGFNVIEPLTGPLTVTGCTGATWVQILDANSNQPVTFSGGTLACEVRAPIPCILLHGGRLTLSDMAITRRPSPEVPTERAWSLVDGAHLWLVGTTVAGPTGTADTTSLVTVLP
jgi:hypothetical protein